MVTKTLTTASLAHRCIVTRGDHRGVGGVTRPRHPGAVLHRGLDLGLVNTLSHCDIIGQLSTWPSVVKLRVMVMASLMASAPILHVSRIKAISAGDLITRIS